MKAVSASLEQDKESVAPTAALRPSTDHARALCMPKAMFPSVLNLKRQARRSQEQGIAKKKIVDSIQQSEKFLATPPVPAERLSREVLKEIAARRLEKKRK